MRLFTPALCLFLLTSVITSVNAEQDLTKIKHPLKPMLWKIEGKGLKNPSYLFGTIHLADPRLTHLHPTAQKAFDDAVAVYTEVNLSPAAQMKAMPLFLRKGDESLEELIGKELVSKLDAELKIINPAFGVEPFQKMKIWMLAMMLPQLEAQINGKQPLDMQLWNRAEKAEKKVAALETYKGQLGRLDQLTLDEQKELLSVSLKILSLSREKKVDPYEELVNAYLLGDLLESEKILSKNSYMGIEFNPELNKKFLDLLLVERNQDMAKVILEDLSVADVGTHFFAAGTAHYLGPHSVNHLLKKAGFTVTRVE